MTAAEVSKASSQMATRVRAALLIHTAEYEGFGLTGLKAMACGCPVVASDVPALREVGGAAVSYCRVADVDQWTHTAGHLLRLRLSQDDEWCVRCQTGQRSGGEIYLGCPAYG